MTCTDQLKCDENLDNDFNEIDYLSNDIEVNLSFENSRHSSEKDGESSFDPNIWEKNNQVRYLESNFEIFSLWRYQVFLILRKLRLIRIILAFRV